MTVPEFPPDEPAPELPPEPGSAGSPARLARWGTRAAGFLIDYAPIWILAILFFNNETISVFLGLVNLGYVAYLGYLDGVRGQTPGKAMMGISLVDRRGELIGAGAGVGRKFVHILDSLVCGLGWLLPLVDAKRQTLADKVMSTFVVEGAEKKPFSIDLWTPPSS